MELITINKETCKKDGFCLKECPKGIIEFGKDGFPAPTGNADEQCINCGHCVAVCPHASLNHKNLNPGECTPLKDELQLSADQVEQFFKSRRSIRNFKQKPVDRATLERLIDMARFAPTGHNSQPVKWMVFSDADRIRGISEHTVGWMRFMVKEQPDMAAGLNLSDIIERWEDGIDTVCRKAPHMFFVYGDAANPMAPAACSIAMTHLELAVPGLELGACWAGYVHAAALYWPPMQEFLGITDDQKIHGAMMIGYPVYKYHRIPKRNDAQVSWL